MARVGIIALALALFLGMASMAVAETTWQDKQAQVGAENWEAWLNQQKTMPISKEGCECPKPDYPDCPSGFNKIGGMLLENMATVDKWGDTTMYPGSTLEINTRMCADQSPTICKRWDACSVCKPQ